ncbi:hypothetical protein ACFQY7_47190 [Actinomadura luteofluorescens]|uniref:hypothetical protein n=1 Tax=Actinomadura luteofluorescens TaxID=46163 RepID=UPI00362D4EC7
MIWRSTRPDGPHTTSRGIRSTASSMPTPPRRSRARSHSTRPRRVTTATPADDTRSCDRLRSYSQ